jgi:undecaprenyl-diphosphatase
MALFQKILEFDTEFFLYLNSFHNDFWDTIMLMVTRKETWIPFFAVILFFVFKNYRSKWWLVVFFLALTVLLADQLSVLLKETIQRLRPVHNPEIEHLVHNVLRKGGLHGFVSSHAANSFALFAFTTRLFRNRGYWFLMLCWATLFSYSRIYSGVHYPLDILGGAVLGWLIGVGTYKALETQQSGLIFLVFCVLAVTVVIMTYILHHYNYL